MRRLVVLLSLLALTCGRGEQTSQEPSPPPTAPTLTSPPVVSPSVAYGKAMDWFRTTHGFHFIITAGDVHAEGDMQRSAIGAERVRFRDGKAERIAVATQKGIAWYAGHKSDPNPPDYGTRVFQIATVAIDPQKQEGEPQVVRPGAYRFTNAANGDVHEVTLDGQGRIASVKIASKFQPASIVITHPDEPVNIAAP